MCAYVFGFGQSRRSIVRRCIILLGVKGDDFITDPGNHSPKLTLFSVKAVLVPPRTLPVQFHPCRFLQKEKEKERSVDVMYSKRVSRVFFFFFFAMHNEPSRKNDRIIARCEVTRIFLPSCDMSISSISR